MFNVGGISCDDVDCADCGIGIAWRLEERDKDMPSSRGERGIVGMDCDDETRLSVVVAVADGVGFESANRLDCDCCSTSI